MALSDADKTMRDEILAASDLTRAEEFDEGGRKVRIVFSSATIHAGSTYVMDNIFINPIGHIAQGAQKTIEEYII